MLNTQDITPTCPDCHGGGGTHVHQGEDQRSPPARGPLTIHSICVTHTYHTAAVSVVHPVALPTEATAQQPIDSYRRMSLCNHRCNDIVLSHHPRHSTSRLETMELTRSATLQRRVPTSPVPTYVYHTPPPPHGALRRHTNRSRDDLQLSPDSEVSQHSIAP